MSESIILIGGSGHARVIIDCIRASGAEVFGILDDGLEAGTEVLNVPVLGKTTDYEQYAGHPFLIAIGSNAVRRMIAQRLNVRWATVVHPSAVVSGYAAIGGGTVIMPRAVINAGAEVGDHCIINTGAIVEHDNVLGDFVHISPNAALGGTVRVGEGTHIGIGACVRNNINICGGCTVGAGAAVVKDITEPGTYVGVPAGRIKMKILILANFDVGLYQFRRELIAALLKEHEVVISLPDGDLVRPLEEMGCRSIDTPVDRRGINPVTDGKLLLRYVKLLRQEKPDLVITYTIKPNIYGGMACRLLGVPYAVNITGLGTAFQKQGALRALVTGLYRTALKKAKVVFFENRGNMQVLLHEKIVGADSCRCLNGAGVNLEHFRIAPYPGEAAPVRFLFIGRVMAEKGVDELFGVMGRLRREGFGCTLDVLGHFEEHYEAKIRQGETEGWLHYHGQQKDVRPFIENAHCFVLPSWHEGMANTNLECAAMGRPVITSRIHGCMESVEEHVSGLLCEPKDAGSLYDAMKRFLSMSQAERAAMGLAGRIHMEDVFDKKKVVSETLKGLGL